MRKFLVFAVAFLVAAGATVLLLRSETGPEVDGPRVTIDAGGHHIEGVLGTSASYRFLWKDEGVAMGTFAGDAFVTMLPFETAEKLRAKYGDFFRCDEPGALRAIQQMETAILVADAAQTQRGMADALGLVRKSRIPVVSFTGARLHVVEHTYMGMQVHDGTGIPIYYVTDFEIVKADYWAE